MSEEMELFAFDMSNGMTYIGRKAAVDESFLLLKDVLVVKTSVYTACTAKKEYKERYELDMSLSLNPGKIVAEYSLE